MAEDPLAQISDDPETCQFIASALLTFMKSERPNRGRWSARRVAEYITASEEITGQISATTLGRFLDPESGQSPGVDTVHALAGFLIYRNWIDHADLALFGKLSRLRQMNELASFYGVKDTKAQQAFLHDMAGTYAGIHVVGRYLGIHRFSLRCEPGVSALIARETFRTFDLGSSAASWLPEHLALSDFFKLSLLVGKAGGRPLKSIKHGGAMVVGSGMALAVLRPDPVGFESAIAFKAIAFEGDHISNFEGARANGWRQVERGDFVQPVRVQDAKDELERAKLLAVPIDLLKFPYLEKRQKKLDVTDEIEVEDSEYLKHFLTMNSIIPEDNAAEIDQRLLQQYEQAAASGTEPPERLQLAYENRVLSKFRALLRDGIDPNVAQSETGLPLIFEIAAVGEMSWLEALIACDQLDLTVRDPRGMPPSFHAGLSAREAAEVGDHREAAAFGEMYRRLLKAEEEQGQSAAPAKP